MNDLSELPLTDARAIEALPKQRRFLILTSLGLISYYWLALSVKSWQFSSVAFDVTRKEHLVAALWIVWAWSLWRYAQRVYELWTKVAQDILVDVDAEDVRIALAKSQREAVQRAAREKWGEPGATITRLKVTLLGLLSDRPAGKFDYIPNEKGGRTYPKVRVSFSYRSPDGGITSTDTSFVWEWSQWRSRRHVFRSWFAALVRLPAFSEHVAPVVLALAAAFGPLYDGHAPSEPPCSIRPVGGASLCVSIGVAPVNAPTEAARTA